jgi:hypothetical protein
MLGVLDLSKNKADARDFRLDRGDDGYERIVYAEVLVPETLNAYDDYFTEKSVREFAYAYMINGFAIDVEHDENDISGKAYVVESFIARTNDPDFIEGSWVMGMYIKDDDLWEQVKNRELNGFSFQAMVKMFGIEIDIPFENNVTGVVESDPIDGHSHEFFVMLDDDGKIISGGTTETNEHTHDITRHTFTGEAENHIHVFNYVARTGDYEESP